MRQGMAPHIDSANWCVQSEKGHEFKRMECWEGYGKIGREYRA